MAKPLILPKVILWVTVRIVGVKDRAKYQLYACVAEFPQFGPTPFPRLRATGRAAQCCAPAGTSCIFPSPFRLPRATPTAITIPNRKMCEHSSPITTRSGGR